jgi:hypothetical protein
MPDNLQEKMWDIAFKYSQNLGFTFEKNCEGELRDRIDKSVKQMQKKNQTDRLEEALFNVKRLIETMVDEAQKKGYNSLHEDTLKAALEKLCPIWPFC